MESISHFKILQRMKHDHLGAVCRAEDIKLKRQVRLRLLSEQLIPKLESKAKLFHQCQTLSSFEHPNIASIYEILQTEDQLLISSAYLEGKSLKEILEDRMLFLDQILLVAIQIAEGLRAAHDQGILHLDLSPESIILTREGKVKIVDFGLAEIKQASLWKLDRFSPEKMSYLSPEQVQNSRVDSRSDLFSLGVILYEMITRHPPFKGKDKSSIIESLLNAPPEPLSKYRRDLPDQLQAIIDKLLEKKPASRYQNADVVLLDLKRLKQKLASGKPAIIRKIRPRYNKALVPALIISLIIAVILILILNKYLFKPIFEKRGSLDSDQPLVAMRSGNLFEERNDGLYQNAGARYEGKELLDAHFGSSFNLGWNLSPSG